MTTEKNPFEALGKAELNYIREFNKLLENWQKLSEYIKSFVDQNKEYSVIMANINALMIVLPLSSIIINTLHTANITLIQDMLKQAIPPLKIECPKCKTVCWDITELKEFLNINKKE